ncbi:methyltransferase [Gloeomargarita lithophora Alchichica-D10]|uniref:Ribosomal RNA small subunit methyltransferase H n=1 Tax=Gloeomargarita lithophora Alchichica-D10 TaxID=1188229 RepID=A0A1J0ABI8_9CYAN|nr:16S rRNA (cytosine(1402)-N(4))-methyltransferase RsmH [Gloeomargarita lithophora]APB33265.1 methyltransferase [Gloeomargarita lithophora Alchichica-D10]
MIPDGGHIPVLPQAVRDYLQPQAGEHFLDATVGLGGHSELLLQTPHIDLTAIDRDAQALVLAQQRLRGYAVTWWPGNYGDYPGGEFDGILADLGVSSLHLDRPERGFSFRQAGPLDMRMDQGQARTAAEIINHASEVDLVALFSRYGEAPFARRIARSIVQKRPFSDTVTLAETIRQAVPPAVRYGRIHPATQVFQALRVAVNGELDSLERFLQRAPAWLKPGGRLVVISFHSLEDRLVKWAFRRDERLEILTPKPITPSAQEQAENPRSRSAKLRAARRW